MVNRFLYFLIFLFGLYNCSENNSKDEPTENSKLFSRLDDKSSGLLFANTLTENDSLNYFTYAYIYMGGGVSAGDINNDGLIDLYFSGNMVPNKLYLNKGDLQFEDISLKAGVEGNNQWYTGTTMADVNGDGFMDIYCSVGGKFGPKNNQLFINNGDGTFTEKAEEYGIDDASNSVQGTFFDYDLDGDLDLYVANYPPTQFNAPNYYYKVKQQYPKANETDKLYRNDGNVFTDVSKEAGVSTFGLTLSATVGDLNNDGWPDLYVSNDFSTPDYLLINNKDGTFSEQSKKLTKNTSFYGMGVDIADFNNDQLLDILQVDMNAQNNRRSKANMASMNPSLFWSTVNAGFHYQYMQNSLQLNNGNLIDSLPDFSNVARLSGVSSTDWSWGPLFADLDNDGWKDIFISNGTRREINNRDFFLAIEKTGVHPDSTLAKSLAIPSEKIDNLVYRNMGDLNFKTVNQEWGIVHEGFSNGCVYADLDNDGDLDIVTNNIDEIASIFENKSSDKTNYLELRFKGNQKNTHGLGVRAIIFQNGLSQLQELTLTRGFQSSVAPRLHFGLGNSKNVDSLVIQWPDGRQQKVVGPKINTSHLYDYVDATEINTDRIEIKKLFESTNQLNEIISHRHIENFYDDFAKEILLPHKTSMFGPNLAVGDLNNDGQDDLIIGGAKDQPTTLFLQKDGKLIKMDNTDFEMDSVHEDMGIHLFDADGDADMDIYVVSGGNEFETDSPLLQDRLYLNDGKGNFTRSKNKLPAMLNSGSRVKSFDYDKDGDLDIFVAGRLKPGHYPSPVNSYILENIQRRGETEFIDVSSVVLPELQSMGMVTDAVWVDFDGDEWTDLIVVGEWMNVRAFKNEEGVFKEVTDSYGLSDTSGWWFSINAADFDNDGDIDFMAGNLGLNYKYKADEKETFDIYFNDFDNNETNDIVLSYYNEGEKFPVRGRECSSQQMPIIKQKFKNYDAFSQATLEDIYSPQNLENALHYQVKSFASAYFENVDGKFVRHNLPNLAQLSSINQILIDDFDKDGILDALIAGNLYSSEVETPRNDASNGLLLTGNGKGGFSIMNSLTSGFYVPGDVKDMAEITISGQKYIVVAKNNDSVQLVKRLVVTQEKVASSIK